jgi:hypothetical protein
MRRPRRSFTLCRGHTVEDVARLIHKASLTVSARVAQIDAEDVGALQPADPRQMTS